jgi:citrate synthase
MVDPTPYGDNGTINALHTIQTDLTTSHSLTHVVNSSFYELISTKEAIAPYISPDPTAAPATHHYTQLLFRQPANFTIPPAFEYYMPLDPKNITDRVAFPLPKFVQAAGLGDPVAGNYFSLSLSSGGSTTSSGAVPSATAVSSSSSAASPTASHSDAGESFASSFLLSVAVSALWMIGL